MSLSEAKTRRVTVDEYYRMADMGMFEGRRVELIDGEIVETAPQRDRHAAALSLTGKALSKVFGEGYWAGLQHVVLLRHRNKFARLRFRGGRR